MEKDFAKEIEAKKVLIQESLAEMKQARTDFVKGIVPFADKWIRKIARQYIERNPERALKLGKESLSLLKTKVAKLCSDIESICGDVFSSDEYWPETRELLQKNQLGIRIVFGKLGTILEEFGFVKTQSQTEKSQESWNQYDSSGNRREFDGTPVYPHSIELPDDLRDVLEEYRKTILRKDSMLEDIKRLELETLQAQATTLWDSI